MAAIQIQGELALAGVSQLALLTSFMGDGRIRALAVTGARRSPFDPDIPTIAEQGFPGYAATNWYAIAVSSKVPPRSSPL